MGGWRKAALCTSIPRDQTLQPNHDSTQNHTPRFGSKFARFMTQRQAPKLNCKNWVSSSTTTPRSPYAFAQFLKSTLGLSKSRCGICLQSLKTCQQGTCCLLTFECAHSFHPNCLSSNQPPICPLCTSKFKHIPPQTQIPPPPTNKTTHSNPYQDDEPLATPHFNTIPESEDNDEHQSQLNPLHFKDVQISFSSHSSMVSSGRNFETHVSVLKVKAPPIPENATFSNNSHRSPIDVVAVVDVGSRLHEIKRAVRLVISSLSSRDRLSLIVSSSSSSKRLFPLIRMSNSGRTSARRVVDRIISGEGTFSRESIKKSVNVLEDRRERNPAATIIVLTFRRDHAADSPSVAFSRVSEFPVHVVKLGDREDSLAKCISSLLTTVLVRDIRVRVRLAHGSAPAEIPAVYSNHLCNSVFAPGSIRVGDLYPEEERQVLVELKVPVSGIGSRHVLSVRCSYRDPWSKEIVNGRDRSLVIPRPQAIRSSGPSIERLRNLFVSTRALAESSRLMERDEFEAARQLLLSAQALLQQSWMGQEFVWGLEGQLAEIDRLRTRHVQRIRFEDVSQLTPTSAWKAAERLAKVAMMRKSVNRVSDLHGFENAGF